MGWGRVSGLRIPGVHAGTAAARTELRGTKYAQRVTSRGCRHQEDPMESGRASMRLKATAASFPSTVSLVFLFSHSWWQRRLCPPGVAVPCPSGSSYRATAYCLLSADAGAEGLGDSCIKQIITRCQTNLSKEQLQVQHNCKSQINT